MNFPHQQTFESEKKLSKSVLPLPSVDQRSSFANTDITTKPPTEQLPVVSNGRRFSKRKYVRRLNRNKVRLLILWGRWKELLRHKLKKITQ